MDNGPLFRALLGHVYGRAGQKVDALGILKGLTTMSAQRYVSPMDFALIFAGWGMRIRRSNGWRRHTRRATRVPPGSIDVLRQRPLGSASLEPPDARRPTCIALPEQAAGTRRPTIQLRNRRQVSWGRAHSQGIQCSTSRPSRRTPPATIVEVAVATRMDFLPSTARHLASSRLTFSGCPGQRRARLHRIRT